MSDLLIAEPPLQALPSLAKRVGIDAAIFLQQLHYWSLRTREAAEGWVYKTHEEWIHELPWLSESTLKRLIKRLVDADLVDAKQPGGADRTKHYRVNYAALKGANRPDQGATLNGSTGQSDLMLDRSETTSETTAEQQRVSALTAAVDFVWDHFKRTRDASVRGSDVPATAPPDERKLIRDAVKAAGGGDLERGVRRCCRAIDGLFGSDFHQCRERPGERTAGRRHTQLSDVLRARRPGQYGNGQTLLERIDYFCGLRDDQEARAAAGEQAAEPADEDRLAAQGIEEDFGA